MRSLSSAQQSNAVTIAHHWWPLQTANSISHLLATHGDNMSVDKGLQDNS